MRCNQTTMHDFKLEIKTFYNKKSFVTKKKMVLDTKHLNRKKLKTLLDTKPKTEAI